MKILCGCISKNLKEIDGREFEVNTLEEFIELFKENKELHINYFRNEKDLDIWLRRV